MKFASLVSRLKHIYNEFKLNWRDSYWWRLALQHAFFPLYYGRIRRNRGIFVMEEDWDNLIILDGCRYDLFRDVTGTDADHRISRGSNTQEFVVENFGGHRLDDVVMINANPLVGLLAKNSFYKTIPVWKLGWDSKLNTVLPQTMLESAMEAAAEYPDKKLIVWFMQPHYPFIGNPEIAPYGIRRDRELAESGKSEYPFQNPWIEAYKDNLDIEIVWEAYTRNLEIVVPYAFELAQKLRGKSVITSDHGTTFRRLPFPFCINVPGHLPNLYVPELITVPWLVFESAERKEIRGIDERERIKLKVRKLRDEKHDML